MIKNMYWTKEYQDYKKIELIGDSYIPAIAIKLLIQNGKGSNRTKQIVNKICSNSYLQQLSIKRGLKPAPFQPIRKKLGSSYEYFIGKLIIEGRSIEAESIIKEDIISQLCECDNLSSDKFGHNNNWKYCPGCGINWEKDSESFGCWSCGFTK